MLYDYNISSLSLQNIYFILKKNVGRDRDQTRVLQHQRRLPYTLLHEDIEAKSTKKKRFYKVEGGRNECFWQTTKHYSVTWFFGQSAIKRCRNSQNKLFLDTSCRSFGLWGHTFRRDQNSDCIEHILAVTKEYIERRYDKSAKFQLHWLKLTDMFQMSPLARLLLKVG